MSATETDFASWADAHGVSFDWSAQGFHSDDDGWEHQRFTVKFTVNGVPESFPWRQGLGVEREPQAAEVLSALLSDAVAGDQSFESFCDDFGYDSDSRRAYSSWQACGGIGEQLERLFGADWFTVLQDADLDG